AGWRGQVILFRNTSIRRGTHRQNNGGLSSLLANKHSVEHAASLIERNVDVPIETEESIGFPREESQVARQGGIECRPHSTVRYFTGSFCERSGFAHLGRCATDGRLP